MTAPTSAPDQAGPVLPQARGELSAHVLKALTELTELTELKAPPGTSSGAACAVEAVEADPYGDDLQLALYLLYELHYRGFAGTDAALEWNPGLLELRGSLERLFASALRQDTAESTRTSPEEALDALLVEPAGHDPDSVSHFLARHGQLWQLREYAAARSLYHLKEADPHAWVIPRLWGRAKAAMVAVEYDEFGAGRPEGIHAALFAALMSDLGLDTTYGGYLDAAPAETLATVNLMSLLGLHRALRGALVGHFASVEVTSSPASARLARAMRRAGAGPAAEHFYTEHVEADAVHEQVVRRDVVGGLLAQEPWLADDVVFGIAATGLLDQRQDTWLLARWRAGDSALRTPLGPHRASGPGRDPDQTSGR
ncbi:iron-containing redox enzyme family protein [Streptomyces odontomachi]|uniref:iron-containing redox enzyme family protein n=1 Tax=Streptomyces odontomachi TaxID=2944940 RepID=UPI00210C8596|nr:iron-containing redox enzyme family protein [Streptomyces sp. ODS25]